MIRVIAGQSVHLTDSVCVFCDCWSLSGWNLSTEVACQKLPWPVKSWS